MAAGKNISIRPPKSKITPFPFPIIKSPIGKDVERRLVTRELQLPRKQKRERVEEDAFLRRYNRRIRELKIESEEQERLEKHQTIEKNLVEISTVSGSISTLRDEDGNIILYEDSSNPLENVERHDQFISVELFDDKFDINAAADAVDFSIVELKRIDNRMDLLNDFLKTFRTVLPDIPDDDLQFILRRGVEEQGGELVDPAEFDRLTEGSFSTIIQKLIDLQDKSVIDQSNINGLEEQINSLEVSFEEQVNSLIVQIEALGDLVLKTSTNDAGLSLPRLINEVIEELRRKKLIAGEIDIPQQGVLSTISIKARRYLGDRLGEELNRTDEYSGIDVGVNQFDDESDIRELFSGGEFDDDTSRDERKRNLNGFDEDFDGDETRRNPKDIDRDEQRARRQHRERIKQLNNSRKIVEEERAVDKKRLVDVTFMTELGEATTMRMTIPFEVKVPVLTNIHEVTEIVTGVKFRIVDTGFFKGWFKNDLKVTTAGEYVTGILEPGTKFSLTAAFERFDQPNLNIPDERFDVSERGIDDKQIITLPEPEQESIPIEPIVTPPITPLKPRVGIGTGTSTGKGSGLNLGGESPKPMRDPDVPTRPLEDGEIIEERAPVPEETQPTQVVGRGIIGPQIEQQSITQPVGLGIIRPQPKPVITAPVVEITPPVRNPVMVVSPLPVKVKPIPIIMPKSKSSMFRTPKIGILKSIFRTPKIGTLKSIFRTPKKSRRGFGSFSFGRRK